MPEPLRAAFDLLLLDLDGVVYVGADAVPGAADALAAARAAGARTAYATNNASRTPQEVADHLVRLGIEARAADVTTSSQAGAQLVLERTGPGARVLAVGGPGVRAALAEAGLVPVDGAAAEREAPAAVLQGFGRELTWRDLADAAAAVRRGALWVATNTDLTLPTERGPAPGNGSLVGAVRHAVDVDPLVAGKPEPTLFHAAADRAGARAVLVVGDRLDTDIAGAVRAGTASLLVLTGLTSPLQVLTAPREQRPDHLGLDLGALGLPAAAAVADEGGWVVGRARAHRTGDLLHGDLPGAGAGASALDLLDLLRAAAAAAWEAADAGSPVRADEDLTARLDELAARTGDSAPAPAPEPSPDPSPDAVAAPGAVAGSR